MSIAKIQTGDNVKITSGNFKGVVGVVLHLKKKQYGNGVVKIRAAVTNVPKIVKYKKSNSFQGESIPGQILERDRTIDVSNLSLITTSGKTSIVSKTKVVVDANGKKSRVYKKTGETVVRTPFSKVKTEKEEK